MLNRIVHWSVRHRIAVAILGLACAVMGIRAFFNLPIDAFITSDWTMALGRRNSGIP